MVRGRISAKFCHMVGSMFNLQMQVQKFGGAPKKILGTKNTLNLARFRTPFHFEREYLRNGQRYPKSENHLTDNISSRVGRKKLGKLCSINHGDLEVQLYAQKRLFQNTIFRPYACHKMATFC